VTTVASENVQNAITSSNWHVVRITINGVNSRFGVGDVITTGNPRATSHMNGITIGNIDSDTGSSCTFLIKEAIFRKISDNPTNDTIIYEYLKRRKDILSPKIVTIGDSITGFVNWQPTLSTRTNIYWNTYEVTSGLGGYPLMGIGGSRAVPLISVNPGELITQSIYYRCDYVHYYTPSIIYLFAGSNDLKYGDIGSPTDIVYTGPEVYSDPPTFYSAYKGCIKKLKDNNPKARIICLTPYYSLAASRITIQSYVDAIIYCANEYGVEYEDLLTNLGINEGNYETYLAGPIHLSTAGGLLLGNYLADNF
jgi:hypothetical protein